MFDSELGGQISWLLPVALAGLVAGLWLTRRSRRSDSQRAGFVLWGGTLLMYLAVYDDAKGIFHPYYTVVMAPAVAALAGAGAVALWRLGRQSLRWAWALPAAIVGTALWADALLARTSGYDSWVGPTVVVTGVVSALVLFLCLARPRVPRWFALAAGTLAAASLLAGPAAYSLTTLGTTTNGIATAGPTTSAGGMGGGAAPVAKAVVRAVVQAQAARRRQRAPEAVRVAERARAARRRGTPRRGRRRRRWRVDGQHGLGALPRAAPGLRHLPRRGQWFAGGRALHPRERQGGHRHGRLRRDGPRTDAERVRAPGGHRQGPLRVRVKRRGRRWWRHARRHPHRQHRFAGGHPTGARGRSGGFSAGGTGGGGQTASTTSAVDAWVEKHGTVVSSSAYGGSSGGGTLYYVSSSAATK